MHAPLQSVATISAGNDAMVGALIADALDAVGADGVLRRWRVLPQALHVHSRSARWRQNVDVHDPYGRGVKAFDRMARQVGPAVRVIVDWEAQFPT